MESLNDPTDDRVIKEVPAPPHRPISDDLLYPNKCKCGDFMRTVPYLNWFKNSFRSSLCQ